jgi:hypothetical protein
MSVELQQVALICKREHNDMEKIPENAENSILNHPTAFNIAQLNVN